MAESKESEEKKITNQEKFWKKNFEKEDRVDKFLFREKLIAFWKQKKCKQWKELETPFIESDVYIQLLTDRIFWTGPSEEEKKKNLEISESITLEAINQACHVFCPWPRIFIDVWTQFFSGNLNIIDFFHGHRTQSLINKKIQQKNKAGHFLLKYADPKDKASVLFIFGKQNVNGSIGNKIEEIYHHRKKGTKKGKKDTSQKKEKLWVWKKKVAIVGGHNIDEHENLSLAKLVQEICKDKKLDERNSIMFKSAYDVVDTEE